MRPWFEQVWVVQDVILAREAEPVCGLYQLNFEFIEVIATLHCDGSNKSR